MLECYLKSTYKKYCINPLLAIKSVRKISPHLITLLALLCGISILPALYTGHLILATALLLLSGYFDTLDGAMARATHKSSSLGAVYDIMTDRIVECTIVLGIFSIDPANRGVLAILMLSSMLICITSFLVVGIFAQNQSEKSFHYSVGLMERVEAFLFFAAMIWLPEYFTILAILFTALVMFTGLNRIREFARNQSVY